MRKDDLLKRLIKIDGKPLNKKPPPRDDLRRETNKISYTSDVDNSDFDTFFDFEKDMADLESARNQLEKLNQINIEDINQDDAQDINFITLDEDDNIKCGSENSFIIFEEDVDSKNEEIKDDKDELVDISIKENVLVIDNVEKEKNESSLFKVCKYVKGDGENCKRQAPKNNDYCSAHRKVISKNTIDN